MNIIKKITAAAIAVLSAVPLTAPTFNAYSEALPNQNDYEDIDRNWAKLLQYTLHFYDANMCGTDVSDKNRSGFVFIIEKIIILFFIFDGVTMIMCELFHFD